MKYLFYILLLSTGIVSAQPFITFEYDAAGNQINRSYCLTCTSKTVLKEDIIPVEDLQDKDLQKFFCRR